MLKSGIKTVEKKGVYYIIRENKILKYASWQEDICAGFYDAIMKNSVFPNTFGSSYEMHNEILKSLYHQIHGLKILELGTGSGTTSSFLCNDNHYSGIDTSKRLLNKAAAAFSKAGFTDTNLYVCSADDLPFESNSFDGCICNLSLNFFPNFNQVVLQLRSVLRQDGVFLCSVPVTERNITGSKVHGTQFTEQSLETFFSKNGFDFNPMPDRNGALLYFKAIRIN